MDTRCKVIQNGLAMDIDVEMVAERAFLKAEKRGFTLGHELDDWLEAEQEVRNQCYYWHQEVQ